MLFKRINRSAAPIAKTVAPVVKPKVYPADDIRIPKKSRKVSLIASADKRHRIRRSCVHPSHRAPCSFSLLEGSVLSVLFS